MLAFATAICLARYYPKWAAVAYIAAALVGVERVLELSHHVSDVVAACGLAFLITPRLIRWLEWRLKAAEPDPAEILEEEEIAA